MGKFIDLTGQTFGRLTVISEAPKQRSARGRSQRMWLCRCSCGNETVVFGQQLRRGKTQSCGCLHKEIIAKARDQTTHGGSRSRLYSVWVGMIKRCCNPSHAHYKKYGGRGIRVCDEWRRYEQFRDWALENGYSDVLPRGRCTLDRIDVNGNYEPNNCRWADAKVQANNRRNSVRYEYKGESHTSAEWGEILGVRCNLIDKRVRAGWSVEKAITTPVKVTGK